MDDFLKKRQNAIQNIPEKTINDWVEKMLRYLGGEVWLKKSKNVNHPIVKLWGRKDAMATNELVNFAYAVTVMEGIDPKWTAQTMKIVAGRDYNNAHGAIFEILALSAFAEGGCEVIPAPVGCPGIDGTLRFGDSTVNLSLKYRAIHETLDGDNAITEARRKLLESAAEQIENAVPDLEQRVNQSNQQELELNMESGQSMI